MSWYERVGGGLGFSDLSTWDSYQSWWCCRDATKPAKCVTSDPVDVAWADTIIRGQPRCDPACRDWTGGVKGCTTTSGNRGTVRCCTPTTSAEEQRIQAGLDPSDLTTRVCDVQRVPRASMGNAQQRATWDVKDKLCAVGSLATDPGPVNATITDRTVEAVRRFQRDNGLEVTAMVDQSTALALGFTSWQANSIVSGLVGTRIGVERAPLGLSTFIPLGIAGGVLLAGAFAYFRYVRPAALANPRRMTLVPAYGRDYKSKKAVEAAWLADKDFADASFGGRGGYVTRRELVASGFRGDVNIRYDGTRKVAVFTVE